MTGVQPDEADTWDSNTCLHRSGAQKLPEVPLPHLDNTPWGYQRTTHDRLALPPTHGRCGYPKTQMGLFDCTTRVSSHTLHELTPLRRPLWCPHWHTGVCPILMLYMRVLEGAPVFECLPLAPSSSPSQCNTLNLTSNIPAWCHSTRPGTL